MNFSKDIKINRFRLEEDCETHAERYEKYASQLAGIRSRRDDFKDKLKLISAEIQLEFRKNPPEGMKVTEGVITALVDSDPRVIKIKDSLHRAEAKFNELEAGVAAFEHRRSMLKALVELYTKGYYSQPDGTSDVSDAMRSHLNKD